MQDTIRLDLRPGIGQVRNTDMTAHLEPDSVILRDPTSKHTFAILEQNYQADPTSEKLLPSVYEGKTIDFLVTDHSAKEERIVRGKIIRSGYVPHKSAMRRYGWQYASLQRTWAYGESGQPIIEVNGLLRFGLPGRPLFPRLPDESTLKPTLHWVI